MSESRSSSPRLVSSIGATSVRIGSNPPTTKSSNLPTSTSQEAQKQSPVVQHSANPPGYRLLDAMWRSPDRAHQIGSQDRQNKTFENLTVSGVTDALAQALKLSNDGMEAYFACAEYLTPDCRKSANASGACAFWMDIDCGEDKAAAGKGYPTVEDAEDALSKFCKDAVLPKPTHIICSGGGLHAYWVLDGAIPRDTWQSYARMFKGLTKACVFLADDSRTADIASVLRVPGTLNHKYTPPRPVTLEYASDDLIDQLVMLDAIDSAHNRLCNVAATKRPGRPSAATATAVSKKLAKMDVSEYGPPDLQRLASALATLHPDCDEKAWKLERLAPLALAAYNYPDLSTELYELARSWSSGELCGQQSTAWVTPGGNGLTGEEAFDAVWQRFMNDEYAGIPVTLGTVYYDARLNGWDSEKQFEIIDGVDEGDA